MWQSHQTKRTVRHVLVGVEGRRREGLENRAVAPSARRRGSRRERAANGGWEGSRLARSVSRSLASPSRSLSPPCAAPRLPRPLSGALDGTGRVGTGARRVSSVSRRRASKMAAGRSARRGVSWQQRGRAAACVVSLWLPRPLSLSSPPPAVGAAGAATAELRCRFSGAGTQIRARTWPSVPEPALADGELLWRHALPAPPPPCAPRPATYLRCWVWWSGVAVDSTSSSSDSVCKSAVSLSQIACFSVARRRQA